MGRILALGAALVLWGGLAMPAGAQSVAKVKEVEGSLSVLRAGNEQWREARPNMPLKVGDQLATRAESFGVIEYATGVVLRLDENTKVVLTAADEKGAKTMASAGNVWVNMRKLVSQGNEFELSSPTATAAIRGTVFQMTAAQDSSTDVAVYTGKVAVGPTDQLKKTLKQQAKPGEEPTEVNGPEEVPGPYEVSLEEWRMIVANQKISVRKDGRFAQTQFDPQQAQQDAFVKKNLELDKKIEQENDGKK
jgi:hypothetical protein